MNGDTGMDGISFFVLQLLLVLFLFSRFAPKNKVLKQILSALANNFGLGQFHLDIPISLNDCIANNIQVREEQFL